MKRTKGGRFVKRVFHRRAHAMKSHHKKGFTISLAIIAGLMPIAGDIGAQVKNGDWKQAGQVAVHNLTGFNPWTNSWDTAGLKTGLVPIIIGVLVHKLASGFGINRMLAGAGIPFVRI